MSIYTLKDLNPNKTPNNHGAVSSGNRISPVNGDTTMQRAASSAMNAASVRGTGSRSNIHTLNDVLATDIASGNSAINNQRIVELTQKVDSAIEILDRRNAEQAQASQKIADLLNRKEPARYTDAEIDAVLKKSETLREQSIFSILLTPIFSVYEFCKKKACDFWDWITHRFR